jgi:hypothetical protein
VQSLLKHAWKDSAALSDWSKLSKDPLKQQRLQALQRRVSRNDTMDSSSSLPAGVSPLSSTHVSPAPSPRLNPTHSQQQNRTVSHMAGGTMYYSAQKEALFATNVIEVFTEMQEFFFVFVEQADSHRFSANLLTTLAAKLSELRYCFFSELICFYSFCLPQSVFYLSVDLWPNIMIFFLFILCISVLRFCFAFRLFDGFLIR